MVDPKFEFRLDDDWGLFEENLNCVFIMKNVTEDKLKVATLVTRLGSEAHALLKLVLPDFGYL